MKPWDFKTRSETVKRYGASSLPKGSTLEDWPVSYDELEPYYDIVEHEVGVSGKAGNIQGKLDPAGNVFEGPRQREYPMPPLRDVRLSGSHAQGRAIARLEAVSRAGGHQLAAVSRAAGLRVSRLLRSRRMPRQREEFDRFTTIPEAQKTKNLTIFDGAQVTRIVADNNGKVTGVLYIRDGQEYFQPAKVVLVASYTYENTRLLLLSKSKAYPNGLSNNHGQVGKHYFGHWDAQAGVGVTALFPMDINIWYGAMLAQGVVVDDWADDNFDHSGLGFIGGASLCTFMEKHPIAAASMTTFGRAPPGDRSGNSSCTRTRAA